MFWLLWPTKRAPLPLRCMYETSDLRPLNRVLLRTAPCARAARSVGFARCRRPRSSDCSARDSCFSLLAAPSRMPSCRCALKNSRQLGPSQLATSSSNAHHERTVRKKTGGGGNIKAPKFRFGGGTFGKNVLSKTLENLYEVYKKFAQKFKNFSKIFKIKNNRI